MIEIAISLAIIGIALVAIIGVLPIGMRTQRDNREETIINQDATVLLEAIRNGARGLNDLTNYVYAITNYWTEYGNNGQYVAGNNGVNNVNNGYTFTNVSIAPGYVSTIGFPINSGTNIIGLLSTPEFTDNSGLPIPDLMFGGYSNHVVAYVRSVSGPAVEKPPQDNPIIQADAFTYRVLCVNAPLAVDTNLFSFYSTWQPQPYAVGGQVFYNWNYWVATTNTTAVDIPGQPIPGQLIKWKQTPVYGLEIAGVMHELRLTFLWPQLPDGALGASRQTFRTLVAGQLVTNIVAGQILYFYQSQTFTNAVAGL